MATISVAQAQSRASLNEIEGLWKSAFRRLRKNKLALIWEGDELGAQYHDAPIPADRIRPRRIVVSTAVSWGARRECSHSSAIAFWSSADSLAVTSPGVAAGTTMPIS